MKYRIEPSNWWVGMKDTQLQLMLYGHHIREASVCINYTGVRITQLVKPDSPNYLFIYIDIADAKAGIMPIEIHLHNNTHIIPFPLLERSIEGDKRMGFSKADVLYLLMPDRFAQGRDNNKVKMRNRYSINRRKPSLRHGGDLEGIRQHLDYFTDLGVTALWFTPVLENDSPDNNGFSTYHGYATTDYYRIDPRLGTNKDYKQLIDEAHSKGLKIVMDMIFNHCSIDHPWINDMPTKDWFNNPEWLSAPKTIAHSTDGEHSTTYAGGVNELYVQTNYRLTTTIDPYASKHDLSTTVDGWFVPSMPDLNQRNPHLMTYLTQNSIWWIETMNIDGIRMDTYPYADAKAMAGWMKRINSEYPNFNVVGESWVTAPAFTAALQKDSRIARINTHLKSVMDFTFFESINYAKGEETDDWWNGLNRIYNTFVYDYLYHTPSSVMAFIDNHDTDRFLGNKKDIAPLKQALALLLTCNRIPQIYYGTEIMMNGTKATTDGDVRKDFPGGFPDDKRNAFTPEGRTKKENELFNWLRTLLHWRKNNDVIIKGRQKHFIPQDGVYVMTHEYKGRHIMLILNGTSKPAYFIPSHYKEDIPDNTQVRDIISGKSLCINKKTKLQARATYIIEY